MQELDIKDIGVMEDVDETSIEAASNPRAALIDEGTYNVQCIGFKVMESKNGFMFVQMQFNILSQGTYFNAKYNQAVFCFSDNPQANGIRKNKYMGAFAKAAGIASGNIKNMRNKDYIDLKCTIELVIQHYDSKKTGRKETKNDIEKFLPFEDDLPKGGQEAQSALRGPVSQPKEDEIPF